MTALHNYLPAMLIVSGIAILIHPPTNQIDANFDTPSIFVRWLEMDFRGGFDCFSSKSKELNVEKIIGNGRKDAQNENKELNLKLFL